MLSLWVGISWLPRPDAGGRGGWGRAGATPLPKPPGATARRSPTCAPARGADPRVASPGQPEPRGSSHRPRPPPPLPRRAPSTPPRLGPSHLAGSKGPHSRGGRAPPPSRLQEPRCPAEPFRRRARTRGGRGRKALTTPPNAERGSFAAAVSESTRRLRSLSFHEKPSPCRENGSGERLRHRTPGSRLGGVRGQPTRDSGRFPERVSGIWSPRGILGLEVPSMQGAPPPRLVSPACAPGTVGVEILNPAWASQVTGNAWAASGSRAFFSVMNSPFRLH